MQHLPTFLVKLVPKNNTNVPEKVDTKKLLESTKLIAIFISNLTCPNCKKFEFILDQLMNDYYKLDPKQENLKIIRVIYSKDKTAFEDKVLHSNNLFYYSSFGLFPSIESPLTKFYFSGFGNPPEPYHDFIPRMFVLSNNFKTIDDNAVSTLKLLGVQAVNLWLGNLLLGTRVKSNYFDPIIERLTRLAHYENSFDPNEAKEKEDN